MEKAASDSTRSTSDGRSASKKEMTSILIMWK